MAGMSKNNPSNKNKSKEKIVTSAECEKCTEQCMNGKRYLRGFITNPVGRGVMCRK